MNPDFTISNTDFFRTSARPEALVLAVRAACEWYVQHEQANHLHSFTISNLSGMCGLASLFLRDIFMEHGLTARLVRGQVNGLNHCWVEADDIVYDITYGQFEPGNPVWIGEKHISPHSLGKTYHSVRSFCFWPRHLLPTKTSLQCLREQVKLNGGLVKL